MDIRYIIEARAGNRWVRTTVEPFKTEDEARRWGRWNYKEDKNLGKEGWSWRIVKELKQPK